MILRTGIDDRIGKCIDHAFRICDHLCDRIIVDLLAEIDDTETMAHRNILHQGTIDSHRQKSRTAGAFQHLFNDKALLVQIRRIINPPAFPDESDPIG